MDRGNLMLDSLTKTDHGTLLLIFCLFVTGFLIFAGGMILLVIRWYIALALLLFAPIVIVVIEVGEKWNMKNNEGGLIGGKWNETEKWAILLGWCLPRKHRESIVGDILEDCHEMRKAGLVERRIRTHVLWQWLISVLTLITASVMGAIVRLLGAN